MLKNKYILFGIFLLSWVLSIALGLFYISPNSDDIFYALPALGFANNGELGIPYLNGETWKILFNFPTYSLLQGLVFTVIQFLEFKITFISYRLSHSLFVIFFILISSLFILKNAKKNKFEFFFPSILFLGLLGLIPFSMSWIIFRPEVTGLLFFITGFWLLNSAFNKKNIYIYIIFGSLFIGFTPTLHPLFSIISFFSILVFIIHFLKNKELFKSFLISIFSIIPILLLVTYLLLSDGYIEVIKGQIPLTTNGHRAIFGLIFRLLDFDISWTVGVLKIYYLIYLSIIFLAFATIIISIKNYFINTLLFTRYRINILILILSCLFTLIISFDLIYIHATISVLLLFAIISLHQEKINIYFMNTKKLFKFFILILLFLFPLSWSSINFAKYNLKENNYLSSWNLINELESFSNRKINTFVVAHQLAPLVIEKLGKPDNYNTYWLFPSVGQIYRPKNEIERINKILNQKVYNQSAFWILRSKDETQGYSVLDDRSFCVDVPLSIQKINSPIKIQVLDPQIIYKSFKYTVVKGRKSLKGC